MSVTLTKLNELAKDWAVSLTTSSSQWELALTDINTTKRHVYRGTLESVVARAHAGEPADHTFHGDD